MRTFKNLTENVQEAITMPYGTDFNRPANPEEGMVRYNTTQDALEFYNGTIWSVLGDNAVAAAIPTSQLYYNGATYSGTGDWLNTGSFSGGNLSINGATYDSGGGYFDFDGSNDFMTTTYTGFGSIYTINLVIDFDSLSGDRSIIAGTNGNDHGLLIEYEGALSAARYLHRMPTGSGGGDNMYTASSLSVGTQYSITYVRTSSSQKIYVDGTLSNSITPSGNDFDSSISSLCIGRLASGTSARYFDGKIYSIRIWDTELSSTEIAAL